MKKLIFLAKIFISGCIAVIVLSLFSLVYYNPPVAEPQLEKITNSKYKANKNWSYMLEGFGYGTTDGIGYNNAYYDNCLEPDIVFMGSSHLEALQVPQESNFVYLLNEKLAHDNRTDNDYKCINLGISGHSFNISVSNFQYVAEKYKNSKYVVIETSTIKYDANTLDKMLSGEYHSDLSERNFLYSMVQKIPYARLLFKKINDAKDNQIQTQSSNSIKEINLEDYEEKMNKILNKISAISKDNGFKTIILFHSGININPDMTIDSTKDKTYLKTFEKCCVENNIEFLDVTSGFISEFSRNYKLPYGYANTVPGEGHLNITGHRVISEELYKKINELTEEL